MKRKINLSLIILLILFTTTGCFNKKDNDKIIPNKEDIVVKIENEEFKLKSDKNLKNLYFKENYVDFYTDTLGNIYYIQYRKNSKVIFEIRILYDDTHSFIENKNKLGAKEEIKKINNIDYSYFNYKVNDTETFHTYMCYYNNTTYTIMFISSSDISNLENTFMNNVYFK